MGPVSFQLGEVCFDQDHALCMALRWLILEAKMSKFPWLEPGASVQACGPLCCCVWCGEVLECPVGLQQWAGVGWSLVMAEGG